MLLSIHAFIVVTHRPLTHTFQSHEMAGNGRNDRHLICWISCWMHSGGGQATLCLAHWTPHLNIDS